jgi:DNA primase small subunit
MPHSVNSESETPPTMTDGTLHDDDIAMVEADSLLSTSNGAPAGDADAKNEVKLEDLFADVDSDDEFPSSRPNNQNSKPSSPPVAPSSPV